MLKLVMLAALATASAPGATLWMCGIPPGGGCTLVQIGSGFSYDPITRKLNVLPPSAPPPPLRVIVDTFPVNCGSAPIGCPGGVPQTVFQTSKPVSSFLLALRAIAQAEGPDYAKVVNSDGTWTITFALPLETGNVVLIYQTQ